MEALLLFYCYTHVDNRWKKSQFFVVGPNISLRRIKAIFTELLSGSFVRKGARLWTDTLPLLRV